MTRQCEYKKHYDPEMGRYVKKHIYGEGISDVMKSIGSKLFGQTVKKTLKTGIQKGAEKAIENELLTQVISQQRKPETK